MKSGRNPFRTEELLRFGSERKSMRTNTAAAIVSQTTSYYYALQLCNNIIPAPLSSAGRAWAILYSWRENPYSSIFRRGFGVFIVVVRVYKKKRENKTKTDGNYYTRDIIVSRDVPIFYYCSRLLPTRYTFIELIPLSSLSVRDCIIRIVRISDNGYHDARGRRTVYLSSYPTDLSDGPFPVSYDVRGQHEWKALR